MFLTSSRLRDGILTRSANPDLHKSFTSPFLHCPSYPSREKERKVEWVEGRGAWEELKEGEIICSDSQKSENTRKEFGDVLWCAQSIFPWSRFTRELCSQPCSTLCVYVHSRVRWEGADNCTHGEDLKIAWDGLSTVATIGSYRFY